MHKITKHVARPRFPYFVILATIGVLTAGCSSSITDDSVTTVRSQEIAQWVTSRSTKHLFMDVRDRNDYAEGHIPGAKNYRLQDIRFDEKVPDLSEYSVILVYGRSIGSARAIAMTKRLLGAGYKKVFLLDEGLAGWRAQGGVVETGE